MPSQCPRKEFNDLLQKCNKNDEFMGSTLKIHSENNIMNNIKNLLYTDWIRIKIFFHNQSKCSNCFQQKWP
jgi:hypothetical protein